jgi:hypothetical protein
MSCRSGDCEDQTAAPTQRDVLGLDPIAAGDRPLTPREADVLEPSPSRGA